MGRGRYGSWVAVARALESKLAHSSTTIFAINSGTQSLSVPVSPRRADLNQETRNRIKKGENQKESEIERDYGGERERDNGWASLTLTGSLV